MASPIDLLPTPRDTPPPESPRPFLSTEINLTTRDLHTKLNRLIIDRLPLALPPHAPDTSLYALGLSVFAQLYFAFENELDRIEQRRAECEAVSAVRTHEREVEVWLASLRPTGLARSARLKEDLMYLSEKASLPEAFETGVQEDIQALAKARPHALVAYTWVMYMAIFSGGRWIRQQLVNAGSDFWAPDDSRAADLEVAVSQPGFSFLFFDGNEDGEDIKAEYKTRLAEADALLAEAERQDVLDAARELFETCIDFVTQLDQTVVGPPTTSQGGWPMNDLLLAFGLLLTLLAYWGGFHR